MQYCTRVLIHFFLIFFFFLVGGGVMARVVDYWAAV